MLAHMRSANPGALRVLSEFIFKRAFQYQYLFTTGVDVFVKIGIGPPAYQGDILWIIGLRVQRQYRQARHDPGLPFAGVRIDAHLLAVATGELAQAHEQFATLVGVGRMLGAVRVQ